MEEKNINIRIDAGTIFKTLVIIGLVLLLYVLRDIVLIVVTAVIMASAIDPAVRWFESKRIPRAIGVIIVFLFLAALLAVLLLFIIPSFLAETSSVVANIPSYLGQVGNIVPLLDQSFLQGYVPLIQQVAHQISNINVSAFFGNATGIAGGNIFQTAQLVVANTLDLILIVVLSFYFSVTPDGIEHFLRIITPAKHEEYVLHLWARSKKKIGGWLQGQLLLGCLMGTLIYPVLTILGVKHALLLAILAAILELIPVFGSTLATVPAVLLALLDGGATLALLVLGYYVIVQQFEAHVFYPLVVRKIIGISPVVVIIALVVGAELAGLLGIILSVPLSVILVEYIEDIDKKKMSGRHQ